MLISRVHDPIVLTCLFMLCNVMFCEHNKAQKSKKKRTGDGDTDFLNGRVVFLLEVIIGANVFELFIVEALGNVLLLFHYGYVCIRVIGELKLS